MGGNAWSGLDSAAPHWTGLLQLAFMELGCSRWKYTAIYLHGWDFILEWTAVSGTRLDQTRQTVLDYTRVHYTALSWIELEITIHDSLHRIGLNLEGLFWIV